MLAEACSGEDLRPPVEQVSGGTRLAVFRHLQSRLFANLFSVTVLQAANFLVPLILIPYLLRSLGASNFGLLMFARHLPQFVIIIANYGHDFTRRSKIAIHRDDVAKISKVFRHAGGPAGFAVMRVACRRRISTHIAAFCATGPSTSSPSWDRSALPLRRRGFIKGWKGCPT